MTGVHVHVHTAGILGECNQEYMYMYMYIHLKRSQGYSNFNERREPLHYESCNVDVFGNVCNIIVFLF